MSKNKIAICILLFIIFIVLVYIVSYTIFIIFSDPNYQTFQYNYWAYYFINKDKYFIFNFYLFYIFMVSAFFSIVLWVKCYMDNKI